MGEIRVVATWSLIILLPLLIRATQWPPQSGVLTGHT